MFVIDDNLIKHINRYVISSETGNCNVYVRPPHNAKVRCTADHIKLVIRDKPDHINFHVGTNDFPSDIDAEDIEKLIVDLAMSAKFQNF